MVRRYRSSGAGFRARSVRVGLAVPISKPRYTCVESQASTSPPKRRAISIPSVVLPEAVGPRMTSNGIEAGASAGMVEPGSSEILRIPDQQENKYQHSQQDDPRTCLRARFTGSRKTEVNCKENESQLDVRAAESGSRGSKGRRCAQMPSRRDPADLSPRCVRGRVPVGDSSIAHDSKLKMTRP